MKIEIKSQVPTPPLFTIESMRSRKGIYRSYINESGQPSFGSDSDKRFISNGAGAVIMLYDNTFLTDVSNLSGWNEHKFIHVSDTIIFSG